MNYRHIISSLFSSRAAIGHELSHGSYYRFIFAESEGVALFRLQADTAKP